MRLQTRWTFAIAYLLLITGQRGRASAQITITMQPFRVTRPILGESLRRPIRSGLSGSRKRLIASSPQKAGFRLGEM
jgi:hypothetical protein